MGLGVQEPDYDLLLFGNESADAGNYQVAIRVAARARAPVRDRDQGDHRRRRRTCAASRRSPDGRDVYLVPMPAVVTRQGGHQPAALPVGPRPDARQAQAAGAAPSRPARSPKLEMVRLVLPETSSKQAEVLGHGPEAAPAVVEILQQIGVM